MRKEVIEPFRTVQPRCLGLPLCGVLITLSASGGCTTYDRVHAEVQRASVDWQLDRRGSVTPVTPRVEVDEKSAGATPLVFETPHDVDTYVNEALSRNPGIQASIADVRARLERIPQVSLLPDPMIRTIVRPEPIQTAAGDMYFTLGVIQTIPWLAKLERAGNVAAAETRIALEELRKRRVDVIADVERAYWQVYRLDRYLEIAAQNRRILGDLESVVETRYQVGRVPQQDLLRAQTELAKLRDDEKRFGIRRLAASAALNQLTNHPSRRPIPHTRAIAVPTVSADVDQLVAAAAEHNPDLAGIREQIARNRERIELANLGYWPDTTIGVDWNYVDSRDAFVPPVNPSTGQRPPVNQKSEQGDDNWALSVQWNLPIWVERVEAAKREARQQLLATQRELADAESMIAYRIFEAWSRVEAQLHTIGVLRSELIPQAKQTYEVTLTSYQAGDVEFVSIIDNWRRWLDFELMMHRETVELQTALSDLQREVGSHVQAPSAVSSINREQQNERE